MLCPSSVYLITMIYHYAIILPLLLVVLPSLIVGTPPAPTFCEGPVNSIIPLHLVSGHVHTIRCQICPRYDYSLDFDILPHQELGDDWSVASSKEDQWREVKLDVHQVNERQVFTCVAINYDSPDNSSYLYYVIEKVYDGTHFIEGDINTTVFKEVTIGTSDEIRCTISDDTDPPITSLTISGCHNSNCTVIGDSKSWIGIHFYTITDPSSYTCTATSPVTTSTLTYNLSSYEGISFTQGNANSTYTVNRPLVKGSQDNCIECSICTGDPHLYVLTFEPTNQLRINNNTDFIVDKDPSNTYIAVLFQEINDQTPSSFICYARNRLTTATLTFILSIKPPTPPVFTLGGNDTIIHQAQSGSSYCFKCVVKSGSSLPNITHLSARPTPEEDDNWKIRDIAEYVEIDICIMSANSERDNRLYQCIAFNGVLTTNLTFQNYVGGTCKSRCMCA